ncbi:MAG: alpha/beta fold hydrolase [Promethearchaeota archaeon]
MIVEIACKYLGGVPELPKRLLKSDCRLILDDVKECITLIIDQNSLSYSWNCKVSFAMFGKVRKTPAIKLEPLSSSSNHELLLLPFELTSEEALGKIITFQQHIERIHTKPEAPVATNPEIPSFVDIIVKNVAKGIEVVTEKVSEIFEDLTDSVRELSAGQKIQIGKFEVYVYDTKAKGTPCFVFIQGVGETLEIWDPYIKYFGQKYRAVSYDLVGHGKSSRPNAKKYYRYDGFLQQLKDLIESLNISSPIVLVGHSLGGCFALGYALEHINQIKILVLISSIARTPDFILKAIKLMPPPIMWRPLKAQLIKRAPGLLFGPDTDKELIQEFLKAGLRTPDSILAASAKGVLLNYDVYDQLSDFPVPTLLIRGKHDVLCTPEAFEELKSIKYSKAIEIDRAGHMLPLERPEAVIKAIQEFLRETLSDV